MDANLAYLAALYKGQGHYAEADRPERPHVATSLEGYAALLRQTERADVAARMAARAKAIRAKSE